MKYKDISGLEHIPHIAKIIVEGAIWECEDVFCVLSAKDSAYCLAAVRKAPREIWQRAINRVHISGLSCSMRADNACAQYRTIVAGAQCASWAAVSLLAGRVGIAVPLSDMLVYITHRARSFVWSGGVFGFVALNGRGSRGCAQFWLPSNVSPPEQ